MPKIVHFGEFLKIWSLRSNSVTRQVSFDKTKIGGKCQNSNATFWVIFKHNELFLLLTRIYYMLLCGFESYQEPKFFLYFLEKHQCLILHFVFGLKDSWKQTFLVLLGFEPASIIFPRQQSKNFIVQMRKVGFHSYLQYFLLRSYYWLYVFVGTKIRQLCI